jgi:hypothetical protein
MYIVGAFVAMGAVTIGVVMGGLCALLLHLKEPMEGFATRLTKADVKSVMQDAGSALMGIGSSRGADRAIKAAELAIASPLLETSIEGAQGVLMSIQGGSNLGLYEINDAAKLVEEAVHPDANIIFGAVIDDSLGDEVRVTVIAAGFDPATQTPVNTPWPVAATEGTESEPAVTEETPAWLAETSEAPAVAGEPEEAPLFASEMDAEAELDGVARLQLRQVEDSIVKSLVSIHHGRIGYQSTASIAEPAAEDEAASETSAADADGEAATSAESTAPVDSVPARTSAG